MKVDFHTHILPRTWPDLQARYGYGEWVRLEHDADGCSARMMIGDDNFRTVEANCFDVEARLEEMEATGVDVHVLSTVPVMFSYWARAQDALDLSRILNDHIADVVRDRADRFAGLGTIPLQDIDLAIAELERCVNDLGLVGVEIGTHVNGVNLGDPTLFPVFVAAEELGGCVFVHPWDMLGGDRLSRYWLSWLVGMPTETAIAICSLIFSGTLRRLPRLRIVFSHGGGSFPGTSGRIQHGFDVRPDLCAIDTDEGPAAYVARSGQPARFYVDSLVHDADALRTLLRLFGAERIALGTDYPFPLGELQPGALIESLPELGELTRRRLLSGTALEILGPRAVHLAA